jgi:pimeloyl-ACP methyl ester carboxylesterase
MPPAELKPLFFIARDGARLAYYETGEGPAVVLIHGLFSNAWTNWVRYGHTQRLVDGGYRVIMPDLRGHGRSEAPHEAARWTPDILVDDGEALLAHLALEDYVLGGYSLGARTTVRMLVRGATPRAAILGGMGLRGLLDTHNRGAFFKKVLEGYGTHPRGSAAWLAEAFLKTTGGDPQALIWLTDTFVDTSAEAIAALDLPVAVISGVDDQDNGAATELADALGHARYYEIPGNHMSAVLKPELGESILSFLKGPLRSS